MLCLVTNANTKHYDRWDHSVQTNPILWSGTGSVIRLIRLLPTVSEDERY